MNNHIQFANQKPNKPPPPRNGLNYQGDMCQSLNILTYERRHSDFGRRRLTDRAGSESESGMESRRQLQTNRQANPTMSSPPMDPKRRLSNRQMVMPYPM